MDQRGSVFSNHLNFTGHLHSCNINEWLPYSFPGGKTVKNDEIDSLTMEIWSKKLNVTLFSECVKYI